MLGIETMNSVARLTSAKCQGWLTGDTHDKTAVEKHPVNCVKN